MAISQTMSNPSDWLLQSSYNNNNNHQTDFFNIVTQNETPPATVPASSSRNSNLSPDQGRVAKPLRRRSRASRRTPTTLLNTDTANFRAMVQRFTGGPAAAFAAGPQVPSGGGLSFMEHIVGGGANNAPASGFHLQYPNQVLQQQQQQQQRLFMVDGAGGRGGPEAPPPRSGSGTENRSYENYML